MLMGIVLSTGADVNMEAGVFDHISTHTLFLGGGPGGRTPQADSAIFSSHGAVALG